MSLAPYLHLDITLAGARAGDRVELDRDAAHHLSRVLRLRAGAAVVVADGVGHEVPAQLHDGAVVLEEDPRAHPPVSPLLTVAQGLPKARKLDEVVRQVTELGVDRIIPVSAARSVTQLAGERATRAVDRWSSVARAASEQARRPRRPTVTDVVATATLPDALAPGERLLVAHVGADRPLSDATRDLAGASAVTIAVGPEGGWSGGEVARLTAAGGVLVGLGPTVLRTEHAAAAALAVLAATSGRWD